MTVTGRLTATAAGGTAGAGDGLTIIADNCVCVGFTCLAGVLAAAVDNGGCLEDCDALRRITLNQITMVNRISGPHTLKPIING